MAGDSLDWVFSVGSNPQLCCCSSASTGLDAKALENDLPDTLLPSLIWGSFIDASAKGTAYPKGLALLSVGS